MAWRCRVGLGGAMSGEARQGKDPSGLVAVPQIVRDWYGRARPGLVRRGMTRTLSSWWRFRKSSRHGKAMYGKVWWGLLR